MLKTIIVASLCAVSVYAEEAQVLGCYNAVHPEKITVSLLNDADGSLIRSEVGTSAHLMMVSGGYNEEFQAEVPASVRLTVRSATLKTRSVALNFDARKSTHFGIECDGGSVIVKRRGEKLIASSDYLASESTGDEGCNGLSTLKIENVVFEKANCEIEE